MEFKYITDQLNSLENDDIEKNRERNLKSLEMKLNQQLGPAYGLTVRRGRNDSDL